MYENQNSNINNKYNENRSGQFYGQMPNGAENQGFSENFSYKNRNQNAFNNIMNAGDRIQNAIMTNNYTGLSNDIRTAVNSFVQGMNSPMYNRAPNPYMMPNIAREQPTIGIVLGMVMLIIMMIVFASLSFVFLPLGFHGGKIGFKITGLIFTGFFGAGLFAFIRALKSYDVSSRYNKYRKVFVQINSDTINIHRLSLTFHKSDEDTLKDLEEFEKKGFFLEGKITDDKSTLVLTKQAEVAYKDAENYRKNVGIHISNMENSLGALKNAAMQIDSYSMKNKLYQTIAIVEAIVSNVKKNQENIKKTLTFETYYLPTTVKLVESYPKIEKSKNQEEEKIKSLSEIEQSIDSINEAFNTLLTNMNRVDTSDVMSDMSAMETMMKQDGLI